MRKKGKPKRLRLIHVFVLGVLIYVAVVFKHQNSLMKDLNVKKETNQEEIGKLEKEIEDLEGDIKKSGTLEFVEEAARENGMVKPREIIYIDVDKPKDSIFSIFKEDK